MFMASQNFSFAKAALIGAAFVVFCAAASFAQVASTTAKVVDSTLPKVTQIDIEQLRKIIKPNGKPLLINFWATWCDPCREEFPDLVKLHQTYREKIDFVTISLDEVSEINNDVPKFLGVMKSEIPAFLLKTSDDDAAIKVVSPEWAGSLPFTIIFAANGETAYFKKGKFKYETVVSAIDKMLVSAK